MCHRGDSDVPNVNAGKIRLERDNSIVKHNELITLGKVLKAVLIQIPRICV